MAKILTKTMIFRFSQNEFDMLKKAKQHNIPISRFVRDAIRMKFEKDFPLWIADEKRKQELIQCPF